ncbi:MAG: hypothetical protein RLZZ412_1308, partial [Verrucomicrobiota bacterium]
MIGVGISRAPQAKAANLYWDADGSAAGNNISTGNGLGGAGAWDAAAARWFDGSADVAWDNAGFDVARFAGSGGLVSLTEPITVGGLHFGAAGLTRIANSTLTIGGSSPVVSVAAGATAAVNSTLVLSTDTTFLIDGLLDLRGAQGGAGGLTKTGAGLLFFRGNSSRTGTTEIRGGAVIVAGQSNTHDPLGFFGTAGTVVSAGATLALGPVNSGSTGLTLVENLTLSGRGLNGQGALRSFMGANSSNVNGTVDLVGATRVQNDLTGTLNLNGIWDLDAALSVGGPGFVSFGGTSRVVGAAPITHYGINGFRLQGLTSSYSGTITSVLGEVRVDTGDGLTGDNPYANVAGFALRNSVLQLLVNPSALALTNRIGDETPIVSRGSRIRLENNSFNNTTGGQNAVNWNELLGPLTLAGGQTMVDFRDTVDATVVRSLSFASVTRTDPSATLQLSGDGSASSGVGVSARYQVLNRSLAANVGFVGGWAYSNAEFLKYVTPGSGGFGYTPLVAGDYAVDTAPGTWTASVNAKIAAGNQTLGLGTTTVRSLNLQGSTGRTLSGAAGSTLVIASG